MTAEQMPDLYRLDLRLNRIEAKIKHEKRITRTNKKLILDFLQYCKARGLKHATLIKDSYALWFVGTHIKKDLATCTKHDIVQLCAVINAQKATARRNGKHQRSWSEETKRNHRIVLKKLFKWLRDIDEPGAYPDEVRWIRTGLAGHNEKLPEDLVTEEEVTRMAQAADNPRDKAFVLALYETGARIGEILNLKIKHVVFTEFGAYVMLNGKTGMRRVTVVACAPALATLLDVHPSKDNPEMLLFLTKMNRVEGSKGYAPLNYSGARQILLTLAERAGIKKRIYPHLMRHSSATRAAKWLTDAQMREYYGWTRGSDMPSLYTHLSQRDVEEAIKRMHGIKSEEQNSVKSTILTCGRCKQRNSPGSKFCNSCGNVLDLETAIQFDTLVHGIMANAPHIMEILKMKPDGIAELRSAAKKGQG